MNIKIDHNLATEKALACSKTLLEKLREEQSDKISNVVQLWNGNVSNFSFRVSGFKIEGTLTVTEKNIIINGKLPLAAMLFKGIIEETIKKHADKMIFQCSENN